MFIAPQSIHSRAPEERHVCWYFENESSHSDPNLIRCHCLNTPATVLIRLPPLNTSPAT
jgi:hypothetical protein